MFPAIRQKAVDGCSRCGWNAIKKTDADSFMKCVKVLSAGTHFPRLYDMDLALAEVRAQQKRQAKITAAQSVTLAGRSEYDKENSKRRLNEIIRHLENRYAITETKTDS